MISSVASSIEITQFVGNVEKSIRLYTVLGFAASPDDGTLLTHSTAAAAAAASSASAPKIRLALAASTETKLAVKSLPSTLLRVAVPNPQLVVRELIDAGWVRAIGADSEGLWQFVGCDGQLLQLLTSDKHTESVSATAKSAGIESGAAGGRRHHKSSTHRHGEKSSSLRPKDKSASLRRHHHHHHRDSDSKPVSASTPASPAVAASLTSSTTAATTASAPATPTAAVAPPAATASTSTTVAVARPLRVGFHTETGQRESNEDAHLMDLSLPFDATTAIFAVFDGHGGSKASRFCEKKFVSFLEKTKAYATDKTAALKEAFIKCDKKYIEKVEDDGCTAVVVLVAGDNRLHVAWAGDSRAILIPASAQPSPVVALTSDHKPEHPIEKKRIEASGHEVIRDTIVQHGKRVHTYRIDSVLSVARSIGDAEYKDSFDLDAAEQAVTCVPDLLDRQATPGDIVLLACDGLFDVMTNELVAEKVRAARAAGESLDAIAKSLVNAAINELGSDDNVSVVIVEIPTTK